MNVPTAPYARLRPAGPPVASFTGWIQVAVLACLMGAIYWDQLVRMVHYWLDDLDWSHGFLIIPFSIYVLYTRRDRLAKIAIRPSWLGLPIVITGLFTYAAAIYIKFGYPQPVSMLVVLVGVVLMTGGWALLRLTIFPIFFLILAMPPEVRLYRAVTTPLQQLAAMFATAVLEAFPNIQIERDGIHITAFENSGAFLTTFTVAGACSGMRSLLAFIAIGLAMAYFTPRPAWQRVAMALIVVPVALACNIVRVIITGAFMMYGWGNLATGLPHTILGLCTFFLGLMLYRGALYLMDHLVVEVELETTAGGNGG